MSLARQFVCLSVTYNFKNKKQSGFTEQKVFLTDLNGVDLHGTPSQSNTESKSTGRKDGVYNDIKIHL